MDIWLSQRSRFCQPLILGLCLLCTGATTATAADLHLPGFTEVNQYPLPAGIPGLLGDVMFSEDGDTLFILGDSEGTSSGVWTAPVVRDANGSVTDIGAATPLFAFPQMDTSLAMKPDGNTLFFRMTGGRIGQRRPDGTFVIFAATGASFAGGLTFIPEIMPNAGDLLVGSYSSGVINRHALIDNQDDTFTPLLQGIYSNSAVGATGDLTFIPTGSYENDLMFTNWNEGSVSIIDVDPQTGLPVGGSDNPAITLFASGFGNGPWGLAFDPISGDLFVSNFSGIPFNSMVQISGFPPPSPANQAPVALCQDLTVATGRRSCSVAAASVDAGSFDPDGDALTLTQSAAGPYEVGDTVVTLTATDDSGASSSCSATITVEDQVAPRIKAKLRRIGRRGDDDDEMRLRVRYRASDNCGLISPTTAVLMAPGCAPIPVANRQLVEFEKEGDESCEVEYDDGVLEIEAGSLTLQVTAEDATQLTTVTVDPRRRDSRRRRHDDD